MSKNISKKIKQQKEEKVDNEEEKIAEPINMKT